MIGAGNSAVQIAAELATVARATLVTRAPVRFARQHILGRDLHFWLTVTGLDAASNSLRGVGRDAARAARRPAARLRR
ncbi:hypothetical protein AB0C14_04520 [Microbispora hainanensis]|uniref:hypothetical protein n=1 Tax=Microbispora hainanensis TaxID=568844 RepID=UPI0033E0EF2A